MTRWRRIRFKLSRWLRSARLARIIVFIAFFIVIALLVKGCLLARDMPSPAPPAKTAQPLYTPTKQLRHHIPIRVYLHKSKRAETMDLEDYIVGVVSAEMPISFEMEALKAQAVAARTFALRKIQKPCGRGGADICTDSAHCQAWDDDASRRKKWGGNYAANLDKLNHAVFDTAAEIVTYQGEAIQAFFHSTSGGMTENSENAFSAALPYLRSVVSAGEENAPRFHGEVRVRRKDFIKAVNAKFPKAKLKNQTLESQVEIQSTFDSGRVESIRLGGAYARGRDMRALFDLNSTNFSIRYQGDEVIFETIGYGHGVGMSQVGANAMALGGAGYKEILTHYYSGTQVETMQASP